MKKYRAQLSVATCVATLIFGAIILQPAGAVSAPISGSATGTIGALGVPVPLPTSAAFTGTHDNVTGAMKVKVTSDDFSLSLPFSGDTLKATAKFDNPGGLTGNASGTTANLDGSIKLTLTALDVPGFDLPIPIALLNCSLTFPLHLAGSWDEATGVVDVSQSEVAVPALPALCALGIQAATQIDVNGLLSQLPSGTVSIQLDIDGLPTTTTTTIATTTTTTTLAPTPSSTTEAPTTTLPSPSSMTVISIAPDAQVADPPATLPRSSRDSQAAHADARPAQAVSGSPIYAG